MRLEIEISEKQLDFIDKMSIRSGMTRQKWLKSRLNELFSYGNVN